MVSIVLFLASLLRPRPIVLVRRVPPTKTLRAHLLGLTFGMLFVSGSLFLNFTLTQLYLSVFVVLWFALITYFGGVLLVLALGFGLLVGVIGSSSNALINAVAHSGHWYFLGYCFGAAFAIFYNDLLFLFFHLFEKKKVKIAFAYDTRKSINVIKSPVSQEMLALNEALSRKKHLKEHLLYDYHLKHVPQHPYTIAFVANPKIRKLGGDEKHEAGYEADPIGHDRDLFLRTVDRAMFSLETDPVIGRPEIWSRVRVVTVFNPALVSAGGPDYGLIEEFQEELVDQNGEPVENNLLDPMRQMFDNFKNMLERSWGGARPLFDFNDVDIIFALTASPTHTRSTAHFSDWIEHEENDPLKNKMDRAGQCFSFNATPCEIGVEPPPGAERIPQCSPTQYRVESPEVHNRAASGVAAPGFRAVHDYCPTLPGRIALNVISARHKTYLHEFAHAMSSAFHGAIADEYVDCFILHKVGSEAKCEPSNHFFVNRIERQFDPPEPIPVPKVFAEYNCVQYHSDLAHPSAEEEWAGYFPDKFDKNTPCVMDRDITGHYHFDELLSTFIYDRMMAKISRPTKCEHLDAKEIKP